MKEYVMRPKDAFKPYIKALMNNLRQIDQIKSQVLLGEEAYVHVAKPIDLRIRFQQISYSKAQLEFSKYVKAILKN